MSEFWHKGVWATKSQYTLARRSHWRLIISLRRALALLLSQYLLSLHLHSWVVVISSHKSSITLRLDEQTSINRLAAGYCLRITGIGSTV